MKQLAAAASLSVLIGGGAAYLIANMGKAELQRSLDEERASVTLLTGALSEYLAYDEKEGHILLARGGGGRCMGKATDTIQVRGGQRLKWTFNLVEPSCLADGTRLQIRFKEGSAPTEDPMPTSEAGKRHIRTKLKAISVGGKARYGVWGLPPTGDPYEIEDPELEIIETRMLKEFLLKYPVQLATPVSSQPATPAPNAPVNSTPTAPAKKQ